jgi:ACS family hexuronate transporter-like MFS transporter
VVGKFMTDPIWWFYLFWLPKWLAKDFNLDLKNLGWPRSSCTRSSRSARRRRIHLVSPDQGRPVGQLRAQDRVPPLRSLVVPIFMATKVRRVGGGLAGRPGCGRPPGLVRQPVHDGLRLFPEERGGLGHRLGGMSGSIGAIVFAEFVGRVLEKTGQYWLLFLIGSTAYLLAFVIIHLLVPHGSRPCACRRRRPPRRPDEASGRVRPRRRAHPALHSGPEKDSVRGRRMG